MHHAPSFQPRAPLPARRATQAPDRPRGRPELVAQIPPTPGSARGGGVTYPSEERGLGGGGCVLHAGMPRATLPGGRGRAEEELSGRGLCGRGLEGGGVAWRRRGLVGEWSPWDGGPADTPPASRLASLEQPSFLLLFFF